MSDTTTQAKPITVELAFERATKGTFVFAASDPTSAVPTLYIRRSALGEKPPGKITLTIAAGT